MLRRLSDGGFHSGVDMAHDYQLSKTTIHNKVQDMAALGIDISAVRGKGYRIYGGLDLLDAAKIKAALPGVKTHITMKTGSTNDDCRQLLSAQADTPVVCTAELQASGRGRRGKTWVSPFAKHIYLSVGFTLSLPLAHISGITLAAGVVIAQLLDALGIPHVALKWPNDVWIDQHKVAGILTEVVGDAQGPCSVVIGVGINVHRVAMKLDRHQKITYVRDHHASLSRTDLLIRLASALLSLRETYEKAGLSAYLSTWERYDILRFKPITINSDDRLIKATCTGITKEGLLTIDAPPYVLTTGEVSVRPA